MKSDIALKTFEMVVVNRWGLVEYCMAGDLALGQGDVDRVVVVTAETPDSWFGRDPLYERIQPFIGGNVRATGFRQHFTAVLFEITGKNETLTIELRRVQACDLGLAVLQTTGPNDFVDGMLGQWRRMMKLPDDQPAVDLFGTNGENRSLCDENGQSVAVYSEHELFNLLGMPFVEPKDRAAFAFERTEAAA